MVKKEALRRRANIEKNNRYETEQLQTLNEIDKITLTSQHLYSNLLCLHRHKKLLLYKMCTSQSSVSIYQHFDV